MIDIPWLDPMNRHWFPDIEDALDDPNGLLAIGGDLSPERLLRAYRLGIFPWFEEGQPILWWSPAPRTVLFPGKIRLTRSLRKSIRNRGYRISLDRNFDAVIRACAEPREPGGGTWITEDMIQAYNRMHIMGHAHSVEVYDPEQKLIGGLYGIAAGKVFFGESMFSLATDASKVGFATLVRHLQHWGYELIDCQLESEHLLSLGAENISREKFSQLLDQWATLPDQATLWQISPELDIAGWQPESADQPEYE
jgi:leucyl/phenylalanyl-tRNA--protein transferase